MDLLIQFDAGRVSRQLEVAVVAIQRELTAAGVATDHARTAELGK